MTKVQHQNKNTSYKQQSILNKAILFPSKDTIKESKDKVMPHRKECIVKPVLRVPKYDHSAEQQYVCELCNKKISNVFCLDCVEHYCFDCARISHNLFIEEKEIQDKKASEKRNHRWKPVNLKGPDICNSLNALCLHIRKSDYSYIQNIDDPFQPLSFPLNSEVEPLSPLRKPLVTQFSTLFHERTEVDSVHSSAILEEQKINHFEFKQASITDLACPEHLDVPVRYFCFTCECECICSECVVNGVHETHNVQLIKDAYPAIKAKCMDIWDAAVGDLRSECKYVDMHLKEKRVEWAMELHHCTQQRDYIMDKIKNKLFIKEEALLNRFNEYCKNFMMECDEYCKTIKESVKELKFLLERYRFNRSTLDIVDSANFYSKNHEEVTQIIGMDYPNKYSHIPASRETKLQIANEAAVSTASQAMRLKEDCLKIFERKKLLHIA